MTLEIGLALGILAGAVLLFVTGWVRADVTAVLVLVALAATRLLTPEEALSGFSSEAVVSIAALLALSAGLVRTGVVRWLAERINDLAGDSRPRLIALSASMPGLLSGLVSGIATVTLFIPAALRLARKNDLPRARLLLPIAMAALAGGSLTLIGAAHNLVVNDLLRSAGENVFGFFEIAPLGLALLAAFTLYTVFLGKRLLPQGEPEPQAGDADADSRLMRTYHLEDRLWEVLVRRGSPLVGRSVVDLQLGSEYGLVVLFLLRADEPRFLHLGETALEPGDILLISGRRERVEDLVEHSPGLKLLGHPAEQEEFPAASGELVEVVVPPRAEAIGKTLVDLDLRRRTRLTGVAIWRGDRPIRTDVGATPLEEGDALLLYGPRQEVRSYKPEPDFLWLQPPRTEEAPRELRHLGKWAALIMAGVILAAALDLLSIPVAALGGAALMVLTGILTPRLVYEKVEWSTIVLVGGMYPLGLALESSGAAGLISSLLVAALGGLGPLMVMLGLAAVAIILTQPLHGAAVAVILMPVALDAARMLEVEPKAFAAAVIVGAAATYLLPVGHPAPLLVQRPGRYQTKDYLRFGSGLVVITLAVVALVVPLVWGF
jgi:di/tricarboxylate transporter